MKQINEIKTLRIAVRIKAEQKGFFLRNPEINMSEFIRQALEEKIKKWEEKQ